STASFWTNEEVVLARRFGRLYATGGPTASKGNVPMREAVVVASSRTPLAKSFRGSFNLTRPDDLAAHCLRDVLRKVPRLDPDEVANPWVKEHKPGIYMVMGNTAEVVARRYRIGREVQDEYALSSQQRTARAQQEGLFREELAPMQVVRAVLDKKTGEAI